VEVVSFTNAFFALCFHVDFGLLKLARTVNSNAPVASASIRRGAAMDITTALIGPTK